jgi:hypothetical protein
MITYRKYILFSLEICLNMSLNYHLSACLNTPYTILFNVKQVPLPTGPLPKLLLVTRTKKVPRTRESDTRRMLFLEEQEPLNLLIRCALLERKRTRIIVLTTYVCSINIQAISHYLL